MTVRVRVRVRIQFGLLQLGDVRVRARIRLALRVGLRLSRSESCPGEVRGYARVTFAFCSFGFSFTEYILRVRVVGVKSRRVVIRVVGL